MDTHIRIFNVDEAFFFYGKWCLPELAFLRKKTTQHAFRLTLYW